MQAPDTAKQSAPSRGDRPAGRARLPCVMLAALAGFGAVGVQMAQLAEGGSAVAVRLAAAETAAPRARARPDIVDRRGELLAADIPVYWLHADPALIADADDAAERLAPILGETDVTALRAKLAAAGRFAWLRRGLTPTEAAAVHALGLPGLTLSLQPGRVYPQGRAAAHVLGLVDVDNHGLSGLEKLIDDTALQAPAAPGTAERFVTTLDARVQHALTAELAAAMARFDAKAAAGVVMDAVTGEVVALASLPDFDPNRRTDTAGPGARNRLVAEPYELGSVFKALTVAMALDEGLAGPTTRFDISPLRVPGKTIVDKHAHGRAASLAEIFAQSSNTGAARIALAAGADRQQAFFRRLGLLEPMMTELGLTARPLLPPVWGLASVVTASYGHGIAVAPLAFASAAATLVNGGTRVRPRFTPASVAALREPVLKPATSATMRQLFRSVVQGGTGKRAAVAGLDVGGKTGTAVKAFNGRYSDAVVTSFAAAFPMSAPRYLVYVLLDEPHALPGEKTEAGYNVAPVVGAIIARIAPLLGMAPARRFDKAASLSLKTP